MVQVLFIQEVSIFQNVNASVHTIKWIHAQQEQVKCHVPVNLHILLSLYQIRILK